MKKMTLLCMVCAVLLMFTSCTKKEKLLVQTWRYEKIISEATEKAINEEKERLKYLSDSDRVLKKKKLEEFVEMYENGIKLNKIVFKNDGKYSIIEGQGIESANGTWALTKDKKVLILNELSQEGRMSNFSDSLEILSLNEKELKLRLVNQTDETIILKPE